MITPNKIVSLKDSALYLAVSVLKCRPGPWSIAQLYEELADEFESVDQFMLTIDLLYVLGRVDVDMENGVMSYVDLH